jgi:predicted transposase/invertase (TIGR01784 family)
MSNRKRLQDLTIKDNFMFGAVMADEENCRRLLELTLEISIDHVKVSREKSLVYHPEYKGVRLDVFAKDEQNTHYNVEMQVANKFDLPMRTRYYHGQIDMELLLSGNPYRELPNSYVIFICDFDPFGKKRYRYSFGNLCREDKELSLADGNETIFLSTAGTNESEVPEELVKFLQFVKADFEGSTADFQDSFVARLQQSVQQVKQTREMEERFMIFEEMLSEERAEGRIEGKVTSILEILSDLGDVPENLKARIEAEKNLETLKDYLKKAARAKSLDQFLEEISE